MEDDSKIGMTGNRRYYDDTDYSVDPNKKIQEEEPVTEVSVDEKEEEVEDVLEKFTSNEL